MVDLFLQCVGLFVLGSFAVLVWVWAWVTAAARLENRRRANRRPGALPSATFDRFREPFPAHANPALEAQLLNTLSEIRGLPEAHK